MNSMKKKTFSNFIVFFLSAVLFAFTSSASMHEIALSRFGQVFLTHTPQGRELIEYILPHLKNRPISQENLLEFADELDWYFRLHKAGELSELEIPRIIQELTHRTNSAKKITSGKAFPSTEAYLNYVDTFGLTKSLLPSANKSQSLAAHQSITTDLFNGNAMHIERFTENGNRNAIFSGTLFNAQTGRYREIIFKPKTPDDGAGWNKVSNEYVAYVLNRILGMDYIPPMAYRKNLISISGEEIGEGVTIFKVPHTSLLKEAPEIFWGRSREAVLSDNRILNVLLQNPDAHAKNLLIGSHWNDGELRPVFIDFGASFRKNQKPLTMDWYPAHGNTKPVLHIRERTLLYLKEVDFKVLQSRLGSFLSRSEIASIISNRDKILTYFARLSEKKPHQTIILRE